MIALENYLYWINNNVLSQEEKENLIHLAASPDDLEDRFYKNLEFGTGGLRGVVGLGSNRVNKYTIRKATQGISNYLNSQKKKNNSVVIAYDTRLFSEEFALETALIFSANEIKVYLFSDYTPTPILSYAVRKLKADIGIVITASHNPKEYNGYKVYNNQGCQITLQMANRFENFINSIDVFKDVKSLPLDQRHNKIVKIDNEVYDSYFKHVLEHNVLENFNENIKVIYTPLHGTGLVYIKKLLETRNYKLHIVDEQSTFDGNFPTVKSPNPEDARALSLAVSLAKDKEADLVIGTDPDADRLGVVIRHLDEYVYLTGNEIGVLLLSYLIETKRPSNDYHVIKTIVTSDLGKVIAESNNLTVIETLTGFKFIGEQIEKLEENNQKFLLGYEESYGYLKDSYVRDKDAVMSSLLVCDMVGFYKAKNQTLVDVLNNIYNQYGCYKNDLETYTFTGKNGMALMNELILELKENYSKIKSASTSELMFIEDYRSSKKLDLSSGELSKIELPKSDVIKFIYSDKSWIVVRPSGTEPKLKVYYQAIAPNIEEAIRYLAQMKTSINQFIALYLK